MTQFPLTFEDAGDLTLTYYRMAVDVNNSLSENRINVPVGRVLCSQKWMNSDLVATMKGCECVNCNN